GAATGLRDHGWLHGRDLACHGARRAGGAARPRRRPRRTPAAGEGPPRRATLRGQPGLSADTCPVGIGMLTRRHFSVALLATAATPAFAADYPNRPIKMIAPFTPGSPVDVVARLLAQQLSTELKQGVVVENRPGAGTTIGMKAAAGAEPDGYTLLFQSSSLVVAPAMYKNLDFDPRKSFTPVANVAWGSWVTVVPPSLPVHS